jgi:hypothetical protein
MAQYREAFLPFLEALFAMQQNSKFFRKTDVERIRACFAYPARTNRVRRSVTDAPAGSQ